MNKIIIYKEGEYQSLPMTESLFWNRVDSLKKALLNLLLRIAALR